MKTHNNTISNSTTYTHMHTYKMQKIKPNSMVPLKFPQIKLHPENLFNLTKIAFDALTLAYTTTTNELFWNNAFNSIISTFPSDSVYMCLYA